MLDLLVPILYFLNDARSDTCESPDIEPDGWPTICSSLAKLGLMHIGVFILLLLSGERNFGVRLNKPYSTRIPMDISVFTGTHADLLIIVRTLLSRPMKAKRCFYCLGLS